MHLFHLYMFLRLCHVVVHISSPFSLLLCKCHIYKPMDRLKNLIIPERKAHEGLSYGEQACSGFFQKARPKLTGVHRGHKVLK